MPEARDGWVRRLDELTSFWPSRAILTAAELDLFTALGDEELTAAELARKVQAQERALGLLLNALAGLGIIEKLPMRQSRGERATQARFRNCEEARELLAKSGRSLMGRLGHQARLWKSWSRLTQAVKEGRPVALPRDEESGRNFIEAMHWGAQSRAPLVADALDLSGVRRLLDLGGGPGTYAVTFAQRNPQLRAVIFDLPYALEVAREVVRSSGLVDRIELQAGDMFVDEPEGKFDLVFISSVIHSYPEDKNAELMMRVRRWIEPGGRVVIHDFLLDEDGATPASGALFSLNMLVNTDGGRSYTCGEVRGWLERAGFSEAKVVELDGHSRLIVGVATTPAT
jgi:ubiquinone/menaquinone biosynthesis C-methylase UbiE/DNA-binding transcriptional ArsR family regulator